MDKMTGKGKYYYSNAKVFEGEFVEGAPYGYGVMSCKEFFYEGFFKSGLFEGKGRLEDKVNSQTFEGEFYDGMRRGIGKLFDIKSGEIYEGNWLDDKRHGLGKLTNTKIGFSISGEWTHD